MHDMIQTTMTRREALRRTSLVAGGIVLAQQVQPMLAAPAQPAGPFNLPPLGYAFDALEPHIDAQTMEIHHDRHHATYVANLNKAVAGTDLEKQTVEQLLQGLATVPEKVRTAVRNHGGGHYNHTLFWQTLKKDGGQPTGELLKAIERSYSSVDQFKEKFTQAALSLFGSGWVWLSATAGKEVQIEAAPNQDSPLSAGRTPLLGLDVWEHAYYLKYQNKRPDYVKAFWNVINWEAVAGKYAAVA